MIHILLLRSLGYGFAVLTAVLVTLLFPVLPELVTWHDPKGFLAIFFVGMAITGICAFPGFVLAVFIQSSRNIRSPYYWIGAGVGAAVFANCLCAIIFIPLMDFLVFNSSLFGGAAGGFIYSFFHGRIAFLKMEAGAIIPE